MPIPGFSEVAFDRLAKVKMMDDATLLRTHRLLSNPKVVASSEWLPLLEAEILERGLLRPN